MTTTAAINAANLAIHPLRADDMRLDVALDSAGIRPAHKPRRWSPWEWERQEAMYWQLDYVPSPGQEEFHRSTCRVKVACAGARFGKSWMAARDLLPVVLSPGTNTWILGPTYDLAEKEWRVLVDDLATLGVLPLAQQKQLGKPGYIEFPWGARVWTKSADNPSSLLGEELDAVLLSEASQLPEKIWNRYVRARIGSRLGRVLIPTTPFGFNWIKSQFDRGVAQQADGAAAVTWQESVAAWQFSVLENPHYDAAEYLAASEELPPEEFAEQFDGRFTSMSGRIFPMFRKFRHVVDDAELPSELHGLPIFRTVDFGFTNPTAALWVAYDHTGIRGVPPRSWWVVGEIYQRQLLTEQLAAQIKSHPWSINHRVVCTIGDMADAQARATLTRHGVPTAEDLSRQLDADRSVRVPIDKAWEAGIRTLRALFQQGRIRIAASCKNLIHELTTAQFAEGQDRQEPGQADHAQDCLRYLCHTVTPV